MRKSVLLVATIALSSLLFGVSATATTSCTPAGFDACPVPVTFGSLGMSYLDALGAVPPAWLTPYPGVPGLCIPNITSIPAEFLNPYTDPVWSYTLYCLAWSPCTPCYDAPKRPTPTTTSVIKLPQDAKLQSGFSTGWWFLAANMRSVGDSSTPVDVIMTQVYKNAPKSGSMPFLTSSSAGYFSAQSPSAHSSVFSTIGGVLTNKYAPDPVTGVSPFPWLAKYTAPDLGMKFKLESGEVGRIGSRYSFTGTAADGSSVSLIGRDVSGVILQGDRGFIGITTPVEADEFLAGNNYFSLRLDISGSVLLKGVRTMVSGSADMDFQWLNGNPSPKNVVTGWSWYNFRLPGKCNMFINQGRLANGSTVTGANSHSYTLLNSPRLPSAGVGLPPRHKQLPVAKLTTLRTWKSPRSNISYPSSVVVTIGDYVEFILIPNFVDGEFVASHTLKAATVETGVRLVVLKSSPEYERDCPTSDNHGYGYDDDDDDQDVNVGIMEHQGFSENTVPAAGIMEGGLYSEIIY